MTEVKVGRRKPLDEACTGTYDCRVEGHIVWRGGGHHRIEEGHVDLTVGQRKTLAERGIKRKVRDALKERENGVQGVTGGNGAGTGAGDKLEEI